MPEVIHKTFPEGMSYDNWVNHIRFTLADICIRGEWNDISLLRFINRTSFMMRKPTSIIMLKLDQWDRNFTLYRHSSIDPYFEEHFKKAIRDSLFDDNGDISYSRAIRYCIRLFRTDIYLIAFELRIRSHRPGYSQDVSYVPCSSEHEIFKFYQDCFDDFGHIIKNTGITKHLKSNIERIFEEDINYRAKFDEPSTVPLSDSHHRLVGNSFEVVSDALEDVMSRFDETILFRSNKHRVLNYLISMKVFNRNDRRFGCYFYNNKQLFTNKQRLLIAFALESSVSREDHIPYPMADIDDWFWRSARSAKGREEIFSVLGEAPSQGTRLFNESALMSGTVTINNDPFSRSDIGWFDGKYISDASTVRDRERLEQKRYCSLHHIFQVMAPDNKCRSLLTFPVRVSGSTWMTITTVVGDGGSEMEYIVNDEEFQRRFLLYHSVMREIESRLRRKIKDTYIEFCGHRLSSVLEKSLRDQRSQRQSAGPRLAEVDAGWGGYRFRNQDVKAAVQRAIAISRVFPFPPILFGRQQFVEGLDTPEVAPLNRELGVWLGIPSSNPFFDRLRMRQFVEVEEARRIIAPIVGRDVSRYVGEQ